MGATTRVLGQSALWLVSAACDAPAQDNQLTTMRCPLSGGAVLSTALRGAWPCNARLSLTLADNRFNPEEAGPQ